MSGGADRALIEICEELRGAKVIPGDLIDRLGMVSVHVRSVWQNFDLLCNQPPGQGEG